MKKERVKREWWKERERKGNDREKGMMEKEWESEKRMIERKGNTERERKKWIVGKREKRECWKDREWEKWMLEREKSMLESEREREREQKWMLGRGKEKSQWGKERERKANVVKRVKNVGKKVKFDKNWHTCAHARWRTRRATVSGRQNTLLRRDFLLSHWRAWADRKIWQ